MCNTNIIAVGSMEDKKEKMIKEQIIARGITNQKILQAFRDIDRVDFVPAELAEKAYDDYPLPIGNGQTISQPYIVAFMTDVLNPVKTDKVLEIGTGSGYQAAILSTLVKEVYTIEIVEALATSAKKIVKEKKFSNIHVLHGDGYKGWKEHAPYDKIIVTAAPPEVPSALIDQLKVGGLMVIPIGETYQELLLIKKTSEGVIKKSLLPVRFVPMIKSSE